MDECADAPHSHTSNSNGELQKAAGDWHDIEECLTLLAATIKQKRHAEAQDICDLALLKWPSNEKLLVKKIKILCNLGHFHKAYSVAKAWREEDPKSKTASNEIERLRIVIKALEDEPETDTEGSEGEKEEDSARGTGSPDGSSVSSPTSHSAAASTSTSSVSLTEAAAFLPPSLTQPRRRSSETLDCSFCDVKFGTQEQLEAHCRSDQHRKRLNSDDDQNWLYRDPPRGLTSEEYVLCQRFQYSGRCPLGVHCTMAHSDAELEEWQARFIYRRQQLEQAREKQLHGISYIDQLHFRLNAMEGPRAVLVSHLDFVKVHVNSDLKMTMTSKKCSNAWTFTVASKFCLHSVALLHEECQSNFHISSISVGPKKTQKYQNLENLCQEWMNQDTSAKPQGEYVYRVKVVFKTDIYGTFSQTVVFDFGLEHVLAQNIKVESGQTIDPEAYTSCLILSEAWRWSENNIEIVPYISKERQELEPDLELLKKYTLPSPDRFSHATMQALCKENYRLWMHEMLYLEELAQLQIVESYNMETPMYLADQFILIPGTNNSARYAHDGELFAKMDLENDLSEDSMAGRLILMSANFIWLAPALETKERKSKSKREAPDKKPDKVYAASIENKGKNFVYVQLSAKCVTDLKLEKDTNFRAQVQFQLNRLPKCEMHAAVDKLATLDIAFPKVDQELLIPEDADRDREDEEEMKMNDNQREAVRLIAADPDIYLSPILILGPFGTGKTYTLAQAAKRVLELPKTRILICTHSNSAADLYIREFFHPLVEKRPEMKPLRVYYRYRWQQTVSDVVMQYCLPVTSRNEAGCFRNPTLEDLESHRIVVTTLSTARVLSDLNPRKGFFTHIFIDEAAQALECETLIPLALADEETRIVLAGDHMQLSPEVYSDFTRQQGFHISMLERLHDLYPENYPARILLCENYRSHAVIVNFTSELFYSNSLVASGPQLPHPSMYPLTFFTARGEEVQHKNSTNFFNKAEVCEIAEVVDELVKRWPESWGPISEDSIGIVSPYSDQVTHLRSELKKRRLPRISVERVLNVQGKQFRVLIISTVRTRHSCRSEDGTEDPSLDYGFLSNVKLLNTAITRAQSLVMVVGDPISLCLFGKCRKIWEYFLELCNENGSLWGILWPQLRSQLDGAEMTKTYILNPNAAEFVPNRLFHHVRGNAESVTNYVYTSTHVPSTAIPGWHHMSQQQRSAALVSHHLPQMIPPVAIPMYGLPYHNAYYAPYYYSHFQAPRRKLGPRPPFVHQQPVRPMVHETGKVLGSSRMPPDPAATAAAAAAAAGRPMVKSPKRRMMYVLPPRVPMYPPMLPVHPHAPHYIMLDDPRVAGMYHPGMRLPFGYGPLERNHLHYQGVGVVQGERVGSPETHMVSGQPIQLLPNVKHIPAHLLNTSGENSGNSSRSSTPVNHSASPVPKEMAQPGDGKPSAKEGHRSTPSSEYAGSPVSFAKADGASGEPKSGKAHLEDTAKNEESVSGKKSSRKSPQRLSLETGFSRQFSDDQPTPTEIKDILKMIDQADIEEGRLSPTERIIRPLSKLTLQLAQKRQAENALLEMTEPDSYELEGRTMSYAGALKRPIPSPVQGEGFLEPQTPRTPSGFTTPGTDVDMDPLGILKSLNIEQWNDFMHFP